MINNRGSGILLHPTSLPGKFGTGDFGTEAFNFVDWLVSAGQTYWQMLLLGEIGPGNSPYMSSSAFAGNILLIDIDEFVLLGWLAEDAIIPHSKFSDSRVNYPLLHSYKLEKLQLASTAFFSNEIMKDSYYDFCKEETDWLEDYALFMAISEEEDWQEWICWKEELAHRNIDALQEAKKRLVDSINFWKFCQWCFSRQWFKLKDYANKRGIQIIGDMPIFVAYQSADVWANQNLFELDEYGYSTVVAGVPPDYF